MADNRSNNGLSKGREAPVGADILLVGQPNVGKSVLFMRLTGIHTIASNYPGTTVGFTTGAMRFGGGSYTVVDAPGTYSLEPLDEAARVAIDLIDGAKQIVNVVDATHLERHLPLTLELIAQGKPMVVALNMSDEARHLGIEIDREKLEELLGVPVVPTVARTGEGVVRLIETALARDISVPGATGQGQESKERIWSRVGTIVDEVQVLRHHHHTVSQRFEDASVHPFAGGIIALLVLALSFSVVRVIGEFLVSGGVGIAGTPWFRVPFGMEPLFDAAWRPLMAKLSASLGGDGFIHHLLIGNLIDGRIDFKQSFGLLTTGLFVPLGNGAPVHIQLLPRAVAPRGHRVSPAARSVSRHRHAPHRAPRLRDRPDAPRARLQRARHHGHAHSREQAAAFHHGHAYLDRRSVRRASGDDRRPRGGARPVGRGARVRHSLRRVDR